MANKQELIRFLDQHVFDPILKASPERFSDADRKRLEDVQERTKSEKDRFHKYSSAEDVVNNFKSDLHSAAARRVNDELEKLKLPTLPSVRDQFLAIAEDNGEQHR
jgi:predicted alpha/beta hydrolase family esterase